MQSLRSVQLYSHPCLSNSARYYTEASLGPQSACATFTDWLLADAAIGKKSNRAAVLALLRLLAGSEKGAKHVLAVLSKRLKDSFDRTLADFAAELIESESLATFAASELGLAPFLFDLVSRSNALSLVPTSGTQLSLLQAQDQTPNTPAKPVSKDVINPYVKVTDPKVHPLSFFSNMMTTFIL